MRLRLLMLNMLPALLMFGCGSDSKAVKQTEDAASATPVMQDNATTSVPEKLAEPPTEAKPVVAPAEATPAKPKLGPKTTAASFEKTPGSTPYKGDQLVMQHFGLPGGHLEADFAPTKITFTLDALMEENAYPVAELMVHTPGATEWQTLDTFTVREQSTKSYPLKDAKPGRYAFRVKYGATDPASSKRPGLIISSVGLEK